MASIAQTDFKSSTADSATPSFTTALGNALGIGANGGNDIIHIGFGTRTVNNAQISSATIDGVSATINVNSSFDEGGSVRSNACIISLARNSLPDPSQTDIDLVVTCTASNVRYAAVSAISPDGSATAFDTASATAATNTLDVDTPSSGYAMGVVYNGDTTGGISWTGLTEVTDSAVAGEGNQFGSAYASAVSAETPRAITGTANSTPQLAAKVAASFAVASAGGTAVPVFRRHLQRLKAA